MGYEYRLLFDRGTPESLDGVLSKLTSFRRKVKFKARMIYEYRRENNKSEIPDAIAEVEQTGIYFCDNGNASAVFNELKSCIMERYQKVEILDLSD